MYNKELINIFNKYKLKKEEQKEIYEIIKDIYNHKEFQKRLTDKYLHHGTTTLGEHILEDTIVTYIYSKRKKNINIEYALKISMMHDMYTKGWQNSGIKKKYFFNKHGFTHPLEAAINSIYFFQDEFKDEEKSRILIDGIIHHMYPLPVRRFNNLEKLELLNYELIDKLSDMHKKLIEESTNRGKIGNISIARSKYKEGRLMSHADKVSSLKQIRNIRDAIALITGKNKSI